MDSRPVDATQIERAHPLPSSPEAQNQRLICKIWQAVRSIFAFFGKMISAAFFLVPNLFSFFSFHSKGASTAASAHAVSRKSLEKAPPAPFSTKEEPRNLESYETRYNANYALLYRGTREDLPSWTSKHEFHSKSLKTLYALLGKHDDTVPQGKLEALIASEQQYVNIASISIDLMHLATLTQLIHALTSQDFLSSQDREMKIMQGRKIIQSLLCPDTLEFAFIHRQELENAFSLYSREHSHSSQEDIHSTQKALDVYLVSLHQTRRSLVLGRLQQLSSTSPALVSLFPSHPSTTEEENESIVIDVIPLDDPPSLTEGDANPRLEAFEATFDTVLEEHVRRIHLLELRKITESKSGIRREYEAENQRYIELLHSLLTTYEDILDHERRKSLDSSIALPLLVLQNRKLARLSQLTAEETHHFQELTEAFSNDFISYRKWEEAEQSRLSVDSPLPSILQFHYTYREKLVDLLIKYAYQSETRKLIEQAIANNQSYIALYINSTHSQVLSSLMEDIDKVTHATDEEATNANLISTIRRCSLSLESFWDIYHPHKNPLDKNSPIVICEQLMIIVSTPLEPAYLVRLLTESSLICLKAAISSYKEELDQESNRLISTLPSLT